MTESSPTLTRSLPIPGRPSTRAQRATTGRPILGVDVRVLGADDVEVPWDGQTVGEICARSNHVMIGYLDAPEATDEVLRDGWLRTGDLAVVDADGYLTIVDRAKDLIVSRRREHRVGRGGAGARAAPGRARGRGGRRARRAVGRGAARVREPRRRAPRPTRRADRVGARAPRRLQDAEVGRDPRRAPEGRHRQGRQAGAAGAGPPRPRCSALARTARPWSSSSSVIVSGGMRRSTLPSGPQVRTITPSVEAALLHRLGRGLVGELDADHGADAADLDDLRRPERPERASAPGRRARRRGRRGPRPRAPRWWRRPPRTTPGCRRRWSRGCRWASGPSARRPAMIPASGRPDATPLAKSTTSGATPNVSAANGRPVRPKPVCTSSNTSRMPCSSQRSRRPRSHSTGGTT